MALEESPSRVGRLGVPSRRSAGQAYAEQTFFSPAQSTVPASRFPSSSERAPRRELASDTVVAARPTGGHFGSQIRESAQERQHVLLRHGEKVGVLAFCHGLLKFEPQNARMRTSAEMTKTVLGQESGSAKKRALPGREWGRVSFGVVLSCSAGNGGKSASGGAKGDIITL